MTQQRSQPEVDREATNSTVVTFERAADQQVTAVRALTVSLDALQRVLHTYPASLIAAAYGQTPSPKPVVVPLVAGRHLTWLRIQTLVELATPQAEERTPAITITWQARHAARPFPRLEGRLSGRRAASGSAELCLEASYQAPGGLFGLLGDRLVGRYVAVATIRDFVERLGRLLDSGEVDGAGEVWHAKPTEGAR